jgi:hypothetical protein
MLEHFILANIKEKHSKDCFMKNQIKVLNAFDEALHTTKDGTSLFERLIKFEKIVNTLQDQVETFIYDSLNPKIEDELVYGVSLNTTLEFEFFKNVDGHIYGLKVEHFDEGIESINPNFFLNFKQSDTTKIKDFEFKLKISFEINDHSDCSQDRCYFFNGDYYRSHDINEFMSLIDTISIDKLIKNLELSNFINEDCLEETTALILGQVNYL